MKYLKIDLEPPHKSWRDVASNLAVWEEWDRGWRRKLGWRAGLAFWSKTNTPGSRVFLSRHWPHRLCWSWSIWVGRRREGFDGPPHFSLMISRRYRMARVQLWSVYASYNRQDSDWMPGLSYKRDAPEIYWKHHLEHAEPAGTA
jgi:hypothetical protein